MVSGECCGTCDAYLPTEGDEGLCRALPPQVLAGLSKGTVQSYFPPMKREGWCRCWQPSQKH